MVSTLKQSRKFFSWMQRSVLIGYLFFLSYGTSCLVEHEPDPFPEISAPSPDLAASDPLPSPSGPPVGHSERLLHNCVFLLNLISGSLIPHVKIFQGSLEFSGYSFIQVERFHPILNLSSKSRAPPSGLHEWGMTGLRVRIAD